MRIKTSLIILSIVVILGLVIIEGNLMVAMNAINSFQNLKENAYTVTEGFRRFWLLTERLITYHDFGEGLEDWKKQRDIFIDSFTLFLSNSRKMGKFQSGEEKDALSNLENLRDLLVQALERAEASFDELEKENPNINQGLIYEQLMKHDYTAGLARKEISNLSVYFDGSIDKALSNMNTQLDARGKKVRSLMMGLSLVFMLLMVIWFRKMLSQNLLSIQMGINRLSAGDFSQLINIKGKSEFADISRGVNKVIEDISDILHGLQEMSVEATELKGDVSSATEQSTA
jgi:methyl-accepting chemotaxis protein